LSDVANESKYFSRHLRQQKKKDFARALYEKKNLGDIFTLTFK